MHSWVASICIMRSYLLVFQRSTAFYLQSRTTHFHGTKLLNAAGNISLRNKLKDADPNSFIIILFFLFFFFYLMEHISSTLLAIWLPAFENGLTLWVDIVERPDMKQGFIVSFKCWGLEFRTSKTVQSKRGREVGNPQVFSCWLHIQMRVSPCDSQGFGKSGLIITKSRNL